MPRQPSSATSRSRVIPPPRGFLKSEAPALQPLPGISPSLVPLMSLPHPMWHPRPSRMASSSKAAASLSMALASEAVVGHPEAPTHKSNTITAAPSGGPLDLSSTISTISSASVQPLPLQSSRLPAMSFSTHSSSIYLQLPPPLLRSTIFPREPQQSSLINSTHLLLVPLPRTSLFSPLTPAPAQTSTAPPLPSTAASISKAAPSSTSPLPTSLPFSGSTLATSLSSRGQGGFPGLTCRQPRAQPRIPLRRTPPKSTPLMHSRSTAKRTATAVSPTCALSSALQLRQFLVLKTFPTGRYSSPMARCALTTAVRTAAPTVAMIRRARRVPCNRAAPMLPALTSRKILLSKLRRIGQWSS